MDKLLAYLNSLQCEEREAFARRCGTSVGYLRKAGSVKQQLSEGLCLRIYAESAGKVGLEDLRPGVDWQYLRDALANTVHTSTETVAHQSV